MFFLWTHDIYIVLNHSRKYCLYSFMKDKTDILSDFSEKSNWKRLTFCQSKENFNNCCLIMLIETMLFFEELDLFVEMFISIFLFVFFKSQISLHNGTELIILMTEWCECQLPPKKSWLIQFKCQQDLSSHMVLTNILWTVTCCLWFIVIILGVIYICSSQESNGWLWCNRYCFHFFLYCYKQIFVMVLCL